MSRYIVLVKPPDDHPGAMRLFGSFRTREEAEDFRDKIRAEVEAVDNWEDEAEGYAYTARIEIPRLGVAKQWALRGEA